MTIRNAWCLALCATLLAACAPKATADAPAARDVETASGHAAAPENAHERNASRGDADGATSHAVRDAVIRETTIVTSVAAYGSIAGGSNEQAALAFAVAGRIDRILVDVGDRVREGEVLARLDPVPLQSEVDRASASVRVARADLEKTQAASRPQTIVATNAQLAQARTQLALARAQLDRERRLVDLGISARTDLDAAASQYASARAQLEVDRQQLSSQRHPWQPDVDVARATVAQAEAGLAAARHDADRTALTAPFSGTVVARSHSDGESVDATTPVVTIAGDRPPTFTAQFSPEDAARVRVGAKATVTMQGSERSATGVVIARNVVQSASRTVPLLIRLAAASPDFGPGAYGSARIVVGSRRGLVVPLVSVVADATTGATQIFRKSGEQYVPVPVAVVDRESGRALVVGSGLRDGQTVAADGADELVVPQQTPKKDSD